MKGKLKKLSALAVLVCAIIASVCVLGACGNVNYSTYTYNDFAKMSYSQWDKKEISYQYVSDIDISATSGMAKKFLFNLYADGTVLIWQAGLYTTGAKDAEWFDEDKHITWAFFGLWEKDENDDIQLYYFGKLVEDDVTIEMTDEWGKDPTNTICFKQTLTKSGETYVMNYDANNPFYYRLLNTAGQMFPLATIKDWEYKTGENIECKTLQDFVNTYIDDAFDSI